MLLQVRRVHQRSTRWRLLATLLAAALAAGALLRRVEVTGDSMRPALAPGDRLLAVRSRRAPPGALVVVRDPRDRDRVLVKRVVRSGPEGMVVEGDNAAASTDSRSFGPVPSVWGRALYRYAPAERAGRVR